MQLTFATFAVVLSREVAAHLKNIEPDFVEGTDRENALLLFASARRYHPGCRAVILTDEHSQFPGLQPDIEIHRYPMDPSKLMMSRTKVQMDFIRESKGSTHIVFIDTDILFQGSIESLFQKKFDIGLTYRQHSMPINGGVIFVNAEGSHAAAIFMERILGLLRDRYFEFDALFGVQFALTEAMFGPEYALKEDENVPLTLTDEVMILMHDWGMRILMLPSLIYNFTAPWPEVMDKFYPGKLILHFKGNRKELMLPYFEKYIKE